MVTDYTKISELEAIHDRDAGEYDIEATETGWHGPAVAFGLAFPFVHPGETILDIGIGTGLGSELFSKAGLRVLGVDISTKMLDVCRKKGFAARLERHDLAAIPYPFPDASCDHAVSTGVFQFFDDPGAIFGEVNRILGEEGVFVFITGDRRPDEPGLVVAGPGQTGANDSVTLYRHSTEQVAGWLEKNGFRLIDTVEFTVWMDRQRSAKFPARAYLARKNCTD